MVEGHPRNTFATLFLKWDTVLPAKSDNDVMFFYAIIRDLESIDHVSFNPIRRIGLIHK